MNMIATTAGAAALAVALAAPALAQDEPPQVERQKLMEANGDAAKQLGAMVKGEAPYDPVQAREALETIMSDMETFVTLFPEGTETGHETRALPAIWERPDDFEAKAEDLVLAAEAAHAVADEGLDSFRPAFGDLGDACGACHEDFRAEKEKS